MSWSGKEQAKTTQHRRHCITDPGFIGGLPELLGLGVEKRMLHVIISLCINRRLQEWVPRSQYSAPLSAGCPQPSPLKQYVREEGMGGIGGFANLGSSPCSSFYLCGYRPQLINLSEPRFLFMKTRDLITSQVVGRI